MDMSLSELQEMVMDREAWRAAIHGIAKSRTWLSNWTELNWTVCRVHLFVTPWILDSIKCTNIHIIGDPEWEERQKGPEKIFEEIVVENFPNMGKEIVNQVQKHKVSQEG